MGQASHIGTGVSYWDGHLYVSRNVIRNEKQPLRKKSVPFERRPRRPPPDGPYFFLGQGLVNYLFALYISSYQF